MFGDDCYFDISINFCNSFYGIFSVVYEVRFTVNRCIMQ